MQDKDMSKLFYMSFEFIGPVWSLCYESISGRRMFVVKS